jgi:2-succinyl-5-enolpyruvyl-6-hydroxy-3-cyclohexene-1-carboxylate synthase
MSVITISATPFNDVCVMAKKSKLSKVIVITKMMGRVVIFDAISSLIDENNTTILYVSKELDQHQLDKKFIKMIGKMVTKDVGDKYFLADYENPTIIHLSNGEGASDLTPREIEELQKLVKKVRFNKEVDETILSLTK